MVNEHPPAPGARRSEPSALEAALRALPDPEIPVITIADLGILREMHANEVVGEMHVVLTPTYSGCPAMQQIADTVEAVCARHGWTVRIETRLSPPWTTDWMSESARERLRQFGIAPPGASGGADLTLSRRIVACPLCGSEDTEEVARFGSTACKSLRRCTACGEPFDEFKAI